MPKEYGPDRDYQDMSYRIARFDGDIRAEDRSIPIVLASEAPVPTFDFARKDVVDEVLNLDGMSLPQQVPLLDSHNRETVRGVLGSIRDLERKTINGVKSIVGRAYFAADADSQRAFQNYADGHTTDFSVGARRQAVKYFGNRRDVTRSRLLEGSAVVIGADSNAKSFDALALRAYSDPQSLKEEMMQKEIRDKLIARGMPAELDDNAALEWMDKNLDRKADPPKEEKPKVDEKPPVDVDAITRKAQADETARITGIDEICRSHKVPNKDRDEWIKSGKTLADVSSEVLKRLATPGESVGAFRIDAGESAIEKFGAAACDSLALRSLASAKLNPKATAERARQAGDLDAVQRCEELSRTIEKPAPGTSELRHISMFDIARRFVEASGRDTMYMPKPEVVREAFRLGLIQRDGPAYNTTGSFTNVMLNATNKTLLAAYDEAPSTYQIWARRAPSAPDYRDLNRIRFGELPDPEVVPENAAYPEKTTSDSKESYSVDKYGELFSISLEAVVNDDLNAISRIPAMQGAAMRRKINKVVYAILTANAALSDGVALFHATSHGANLDATTLDGIEDLSVGYAVMALQTGLSSGTVLGIRPRFLIVGETLAPMAYKLTASMADPSSSGNSGIANMYGPAGPRRLEVVTEGQLDSTSTTAWWLAADPSQVDTVEYTFLQGEESPVLSREEGFTIDAIRYKIRQAFAAKAIDYRGLYQGNA